jgi:SAM-dependent methyltransferase
MPTFDFEDLTLVHCTGGLAFRSIRRQESPLTMKEMWNQRYADSDYVYGMAPNVFFKSVIDNMTPGRLLLPAEGEGRNAVYAASIGWEVHAFDYSDAGRDKALALAGTRQVDIQYDVVDAGTYQCRGTFDMVALVYAHFDHGDRERLFRAFRQCLRPGGTLMMEVFGKKQLGKPSGGPKKSELLYSAEEIRALIGEMDIRILEETRTALDEGPLHQGPAEVVRLIAFA